MFFLDILGAGLVSQKLKQIGAFPGLLVDASAQLARWHENNGAYADALAILQVDDTISMHRFESLINS